MVGGDLLKYWSKCLIELQSNRGKRKLIIKKHRSMPQKEMNFEITQYGVKKKGLFKSKNHYTQTISIKD